MTDHGEIAEQIFFVNNGEIDLLTGAIAQSRFDQIIKRDMQLSRRNHTQLLIISVRLNLKNYIAAATGSSALRRLTNSIQIAIQRGTPILDVLNNQVQSLNKQINLALLKKSGKSEITLLIPVVFLILPVSISFAIWPSIYGLNQAGL